MSIYLQIVFRQCLDSYDKRTDIPAETFANVWITNHLCRNELVGVSRIVKKISRNNTCGYSEKWENGERFYFTSIWIFKCDLNLSSSSTKLNNAISNSSGMDETPLRDNDTQRFVLINCRNSTDERKNGPDVWRICIIKRNENIRDFKSKLILTKQKNILSFSWRGKHTVDPDFLYL